MMLVLQRINADHRLTYGELSILNMVYVTLEPTIGWRKDMISRIKAGTYVLQLHPEDEKIQVLDVPDREDIFIATGTSVAMTQGNPLVGVARAAKGMITGGAEAYEEIYRLVAEATDRDEECFLDVRDGV